MCGISCIVSKNKDDRDLIKQITDMVKHRGPDADGFYEEGIVSMGHRRLRIVDLSKEADQPMVHDDCVIVFNGEIYNYKIIREMLELKGYKFNTNCDTEVILKLYHTNRGFFDPSVLSGMFAFVIYDKTNKKIIACRDRFGIKPLYYTYLGIDGIAFASEVKQLIPLLNKPSINRENALTFIKSGIIDHNNETLVTGIFQVKPGHTKLLHNDVITDWEWYKFSNAQITPRYVGTHVTPHLLVDSVNRQLKADVKVGSCLSGGIDSTSIVSIIHSINRANKLKQVTVSYRSTDGSDEGKWIDIVRKKFSDIESYEVYGDPEQMFLELPQVIWHQDSPIPTTSIYAQWCVFKEASKHVKVMLDGQGADEIFGGYHMYYGLRYASLLRRLKLLTLIRESLKTPPASRYVAFGTMATHLRTKMYDYQIDQITKTMLPALLHWEDRDSMAHSVEARVPFLDEHLVSHALTLREDEKVFNGLTKCDLRMAMRGIIPEEIRMRKDKIGFAAPEAQWFTQNRDDFYEWSMFAMLTSGSLLTQEVKNNCNDILKLKKPYNSLVWRVMTFGIWKQRFGL